MQLGIHVPNFKIVGGTPAIAPELVRIAEGAEAAGATWLSVMDHYFQMDRMAPAEDPMLEGYTTLGFWAGHTTSIRLGLLVSGVTYRHPGLLAKAVSTLDVLSGGRAALGIGAAWYEREHQGLGVPFPPVAERFERLEEALQICLQMWDPTNNGRYDGRHYQLAETLCSPQPLSQPHPQIMIGGSGERKTLQLDVLHRHCDEVGRDYDEIVKTTLYQGPELDGGDIDGFAAEMAGYAKLGVDGVMVMPLTDRPGEWVEQRCIPAAARRAEVS